MRGAYARPGTLRTDKTVPRFAQGLAVQQCAVIFLSTINRYKTKIILFDKD